MIRELQQGEIICKYKCGACTILKENGDIIELSRDETHFSFDDSTRNVHIVPREGIKEQQFVKEVIERMVKILEGLCQKQDWLPKGSKIIQNSGKRGGRISNKGHPFQNVPLHSQKCLTIRAGDGYDYLLSFEQLTCDENEAINCCLGKLQFYRSVQSKTINQTYREKMMYPCSVAAGEFEVDKETHHFVYNSPLTVYDADETKSPIIAEQFGAFIKGEIIDFATGEKRKV